MIEKFTNPDLELADIDITGFSEDEIFFHLKKMMTIRAVEQKLAKEKEMSNIIGPIHLGVGQEAIASGVAYNILKGDYVYGAHRSHGHVLALGSSIHKLFAEILGKNTGLSKGMGGSMHLYDIENSFAGAVPIVAGTVPLAVGSGLASKIKRDGRIGVTFFGDGAVEEGVVHESLNLASYLKLPVLFVVENNLMASHMHISERQPLSSCARFAEANSIPSRVVDGNNPFEISKSISNEIIKMRKESSGPFFIEAFTYRWYGHVDFREDVDVGVARSSSDLKKWKKRDPISRTIKAMDALKIDYKNYLDDFLKSLSLLIEDAWNQALEDPFPKQSAILDRVYDE